MGVLRPNLMRGGAEGMAMSRRAYRLALTRTTGVLLAGPGLVGSHAASGQAATTCADARTPQASPQSGAAPLTVNLSGQITGSRPVEDYERFYIWWADGTETPVTALPCESPQVPGVMLSYVVLSNNHTYQQSGGYAGEVVGVYKECG